MNNENHMMPLENISPAENMPMENISPIENMMPMENISPIENMMPMENVSPIENMMPMTGKKGQKIAVEPMNMRLAHAYVPFQKMGPIYSPEKALERGTVFPELDMPFNPAQKELIERGLYYEE